MDERRQRVEQLDAFVRHRLRLYKQAQEHVQRQTSNKIVRLNFVYILNSYVCFLLLRNRSKQLLYLRQQHQLILSKKKGILGNSK